MTPDPDRDAEWRTALLQGASHLGIDIPEAHLRAYSTHRHLLLAHNQRAGLTTIADPIEIAIKHYLDSLTCLLLRDIAPGERVADVGSGAGFPGLILAVARPSAAYTLIESTGKRAAFLELAAGRLPIPHLNVVPARAERAGRDPDLRGTFDLVLSRAVAPLPVLLEYCLPLARVGGHFLAQKGPDAQQELHRSAPALDTLGGSVTRTRHLTLPLAMGDRTLILVEKTAPTADRYPRRPGIPAKRPLR
jgi:16S rRNA (guanine527-N7)-methyltransferase